MEQKIQLPVMNFGDLQCSKHQVKGQRVILLPGFRVIQGLNCVIGPLGRQGPAATIGQHCPQMTQRPGIALDSACDWFLGHVV